MLGGGVFFGSLVTTFSRPLRCRSFSFPVGAGLAVVFLRVCRSPRLHVHVNMTEFSCVPEFAKCHNHVTCVSARQGTGISEWDGSCMDFRLVFSMPLTCSCVSYLV